MRHKHLALMNVGAPYVCDWPKNHHSHIGIVYKSFAKTVRLVEWFLEIKLPVFQALKVAPRITDIHEIIVEASTMDWPGPLPRSVIEAFINAFPMLCDAAEEINWRVDSCPCHEISPLTIKHVFFFAFRSQRWADWTITLVSWTSCGSPIVLLTLRTLQTLSMALTLLIATHTTSKSNCLPLCVGCSQTDPSSLTVALAYVDTNKELF